MKKTIEVKAQTVELAIEEGLQQLNTTLEKVEVEVLSKGGLFQKAAIKMTTAPTPLEMAEEFVASLLNKMNIKAEPIVSENEGVINIDIIGEDAPHVIGYRGETLDAIQYLTLTVLNQGKQFKKVVVNSGNYREKRETTLITLANRLADKAYKTGRKVILEPMNPFERRIIHAALQDSYKATTTSEGEEPNRHIVVLPKRNNNLSNANTSGYDPQKKKVGMPKFKSFGYKKGF